MHSSIYHYYNQSRKYWHFYRFFRSPEFKATSVLFLATSIDVYKAVRPRFRPNNIDQSFLRDFFSALFASSWALSASLLSEYLGESGLYGHDALPAPLANTSMFYCNQYKKDVLRP
ncbi:hypothetical protein ABKN59_004729 [Abortiporus biennis]